MSTLTPEQTEEVDLSDYMRKMLNDKEVKLTKYQILLCLHRREISSASW